MTDLYPYQRRVHDALMVRGKNVILQAPTGAGKTLAALAPYFHNLKYHAEDDNRTDAPLPLTCRYAVPMRVLASQFEREYHDRFRLLDAHAATRLTDRYVKQLGIKLPAIQTGETPDDPQFESPLTFCTIDQLLASFIGTPYTLGPGRANLNVGAVVGSYLVLDEFHLYPLEKGNGARLTALAMLRLLKGCCRFVLMTATFSTHLLDKLAKLLDAEVVKVESDEELARIMNGRSRTIRLAEDSMTPEAILAAHDVARERGAGASLVVCNTVARAQDIYRQLKQTLAERGALGQTRLELLHSRFTPEDRQEKSACLERWLGKDAWDGNRYVGDQTDSVDDTIIVATQVVEVGLNISAGALHTELAPANSLIQRAGRCARFDRQFGEVIVYPIPPREDDRDDGKVSYKPYDEGLCESTWAHLRAMTPGADTPFGFREEQALIDAVHTDEDRRMLERFREREDQIGRSVMETLNSHDDGVVSELIRNVRAVSILIHDAPNDAITTRPFAWESFQLHPETLAAAWDVLQTRRDPAGAEWVIKEPHALTDVAGGTEDDNDRETHYKWDELTDKSQVRKATLVALPPQLAAYDKELGFRLLTAEGQAATGWMSGQIDRKKPQRETWTGKRSSYVEHITGLLRAYDWSVRRELAWIAARIEQEMCLPSGAVDEAVRLAIACHDIGKLARAWQGWAHAWQGLLVERFGVRYAVEPQRASLAKTDRLVDWRLEWELQQELRASGVKRPNHACASVMAAGMLIGGRVKQLGERAPAWTLTRATLSAIARHHAPTAREYDAAEWDDDAVRAVLCEAFTACRLTADLEGVDLTSRDAGKLSSDWLIEASADGERRLATWLGFVLVRALRLCDQRAERDWGVLVARSARPHDGGK